jgi:hypothetical protein
MCTKQKDPSKIFKLEIVVALIVVVDRGYVMDGIQQYL